MRMGHVAAGEARELLVLLTRHLDRYAQTDTLGRQQRSPCLDQVAVGHADRPDVAVEIVEPERVYCAAVLAQGDGPIHLIREAVPGEADDWHALVSDQQHVVPLLAQPVRRLVAVRPLSEV